MTSLPERNVIVGLIQEAAANGARLPHACEMACIALRTYRRWPRGRVLQKDRCPSAERSTPPNKLTEADDLQCNRAKSHLLLGYYLFALTDTRRILLFVPY